MISKKLKECFLNKKIEESQIITEIIKMKTINSDEEFAVEISKINTGTYTEVYKGKNLTAGIVIPKDLAIKRYRLKQDPDSILAIEDLIQKAKMEVSILKKLSQNPNICRIYGYSEEKCHPFYYAIALELGQCSLKDEWIKQGKSMSIKQISEIFNDVVSTLAYLQEKGIVHSDVKPSNIVLKQENDDTKYKIIDFNSSINLYLESQKSCENFDKPKEVKDLKIPIRGTPFYMSPEYLDTLKKESSNINQILQCSDYTLKSEENTLENETLYTIKGIHKFSTTYSGKKNEVYGESGGCKNDMFSLGIMIMRLAGLDLRKANVEHKILQTIIMKFKEIIAKEKLEFKYLSLVIDKILDWNSKNRYNFIDLKQELISCHNQNIDSNIIPYLDTSSCNFVSMETFIDIWKISKLAQMNAQMFSSVGFKCFCVSSEYYDFIIRQNSKGDLALNFLKDDVQNKYEYLSVSQKNEFLNILNSENSSFENLINLYTQETGFFVNLNKSLSVNKFKDYENFVHAFLYSITEISYEFPEIKENNKNIYRCILLEEDGEKENFKKHLNQYFVNMVYHWPSFTSCSKNLVNCQSFLFGEGIGVIFEIELDANNKKNKVDISNISAVSYEQEILLLPYFRFQVLNKTSEKLDGKSYTKILVKECPGLVLNYKIIWFDPIVNNSENQEYQNCIRIANEKVELIVFEEMNKAREYLENTDQPVFVMSCGSKGEEFLGYIHEKNCVVKMFVFTSFYNKKNHEIWAEKYKFHNKLVGVFDNINDILMWLPSDDIIY